MIKTLLLILFCIHLTYAKDLQKSITALGLYQNSSNPDYNDSFYIQDLTLKAWSDITDKFEVLASLSAESQYNTTINTREITLEIKELFIRSLSIKEAEIMAGTFYLDFSLLNKLSKHNRPFIFQTKIQELNFGEDGLNATGLSIKKELLSPWYSYLGFQVFNPDNNISFGEVPDNKQGLLLTYDNFLKVKKDSTLHIKASGLYSRKKDARLGNTYAGFEVAYIEKNYLEAKNVFLLNYLYTSREGEENGYYNNLSLIYRYSMALHTYTFGYENVGFFSEQTESINTNVATLQYEYKFAKQVSTRLQYRFEQKENEEDYEIGIQLKIELGDERGALTY